MPIRSILAVALGVAALAVLIAADVQGWAMSAMSAGMLGSLVGFVPGYLAPSPMQREPVRMADVAPPSNADHEAAIDKLIAERSAAPRAAAESTTRRLVPPESSDA